MTRRRLEVKPAGNPSREDVQAAIGAAEAAARAASVSAMSLVQVASLEASESKSPSESDLPLIEGGPDLSPVDSRPNSMAAKLLAIRLKEGREF